MTHARSLRLRKKLHVGEFQQFGFYVEFKLRRELSEEQQELFWNSFILDAIEVNGLTFGGGSEGGLVVPGSRASATEAHRQAIQSWLGARPEVLSAQVGRLVDAWSPDGL